MGEKGFYGRTDRAMDGRTLLDGKTRTRCKRKLQNVIHIFFVFWRYLKRPSIFCFVLFFVFSLIFVFCFLFSFSISFSIIIWAIAESTIVYRLSISAFGRFSLVFSCWAYAYRYQNII